jgi:hypothetical protein
MTVQEYADRLSHLVSAFNAGALTEEEFLSAVTKAGWGQAMVEVMNKKAELARQSEENYQKALLGQLNF